MSPSPAVRGLRAAVFAAVCVLLAAAGHGLAMGAMPPLWADVAGFLAVFAVGWLLGGGERSLAGIGAAMLLTQAGLHLGFDAARAGGGRVVMPGHAMAGMHAHATVHPHLTGPATAAHLLAALAASWWLRRGEAALWSLLRRAAALVPGLVAWWRDTPLPAPVDRAPRVPTAAQPLRLTLLRHAVSRRGPPAPIPYSP
ncbi:hypothetical protein FB563_7543 [Streptomyces puniciscabiei]|uniref:Uncharacterized protein n=1 Tax=Streptomyces puniciscabiei TaxID=164348 RepID=A0A542T0N5_9ACTN|nr:hypothetical protein [Streptomyces puniciscabiei]TQK80362.1 hypothetical protein FB563_7543 [Streptomyces puniciscabiei]